MHAGIGDVLLKALGFPKSLRASKLDRFIISRSRSHAKRIYTLDQVDQPVVGAQYVEAGIN